MVWNFLRDLFSSDAGRVQGIDDMTVTVINPATGLPMLGDSIGGVDVGGSPFGMDLHSSMSGLGSGFGSSPWE